MSYKIFKDIGLLESFEIPEKSFIAFFSALEKGYMDLPCNFDVFLFKYFFNLDLIDF